MMATFKDEILEIRNLLSSLESKIEGHVDGYIKKPNRLKINIPHIDGCFEDMVGDDGFRTFALLDTTKQAYTFDEASEKFCSRETGRTMSEKEIHLLLACGIDLGNVSFWSSSVYSNNRSNAWHFYGFNGGVSNGGRHITYPVRCVVSL